jgi:hypothetical protein
VTPAGITKGWTHATGEPILVVDKEGHWQLVDLETKQTRLIPGGQTDDQVIGWSKDRKSVFVRSSTTVPLAIERIDWRRAPERTLAISCLRIAPAS